MVFSSITFLFLFLPMLLAAYLLAPALLRNPILLTASLIFYFWGSPGQGYLMVVSILGNYLAGWLVAPTVSARLRKAGLALAVAFNLALLFYFKYFNFFMDGVNELRSQLGADSFSYLKVALPIGISFFTFQAMSYVIDVYRGEVALERSLPKFALYISLFPQLIAGPIVRYITVAREIHERHVSAAGLLSGFRRFSIGLAKKVILANSMGAIADDIFSRGPAELACSSAWLGVAAYAFQIYFDFSGYSDMAIGLGRMLGFTFLENFNYPYISRSITEFWRRWHMSLSTWFRDYLYIPLGGNRLSPIRTYANLYAVFVLCGLWHGAAWNFLLWGLFHGSLLVLERLFLIRFLEGMPSPLRLLYCWMAVLIGWVLFRVESLQQCSFYLEALAGLGAQVSFPSAEFYLNRETVLLFCCSVLGSTPILRGWLDSEKPSIWRNGYLIIVFAYSVLLLAGSAYNPFIYYRF